MNNKTAVKIISMSDNGVRVCAAAGRISTQAGTALEIFQASQGGERDLKLIGKVLSSGHKSVMEHHIFTIAFENVSVLVEQFFIEHRLASFIVKSRRYVNFTDAGYYVPCGIDGTLRTAYTDAMDARFSAYAELLDLGIPKEDARFVLPYCFHSNFYLSCNARELMRILRAMRTGRGSGCREIQNIADTLEAQFEAVYPGFISMQGESRCAEEPAPASYALPAPVTPSAALLSGPEGAESLLRDAIGFTGRFDGMALTDAARALTHDDRPRELECLNYTYVAKNVTLATMTHYARHRIQSPIFRDIRRALAGGGYVVPATIAESTEALALYRAAFADNHAALQTCLRLGLDAADAAYFALAGHATDIMITLNARELLHFLKLRTCTRAQWEIRELSLSLLCQLRESAPDIFRWFGPSCAVEGRCPEGRMCCGKPQKFD